MRNGVRFERPIEVSTSDVEKALFAYSRDQHAADDAAATATYERMRTCAQRATDELNQTLDIDVFEWLSRAWVTVPSVRRAVQLSRLAPGPPALIRLDEHSITTTSDLLLGIQMDERELPELKFTLEVIANIQRTTLAVRDGQIELLALGKAPVVARLGYLGLTLREHATALTGTHADPFRDQRAEADRTASVDYPI